MPVEETQDKYCFRLGRLMTTQEQQIIYDLILKAWMRLK